MDSIDIQKRIRRWVENRIETLPPEKFRKRQVENYKIGIGAPVDL